VSIRRCVPVHGAQGPAGRGRHGRHYAQRHRHRPPVHAVRLRPLDASFRGQMHDSRRPNVLRPGGRPALVEPVRAVHRLLARVPRVPQHNKRHGVGHHRDQGLRPQRCRLLSVTVRQCSHRIVQ